MSFEPSATGSSTTAIFFELINDRCMAQIVDEIVKAQLRIITRYSFQIKTTMGNEKSKLSTFIGFKHNRDFHSVLSGSLTPGLNFSFKCSSVTTDISFPCLYVIFAPPWSPNFSLYDSRLNVSSQASQITCQKIRLRDIVPSSTNLRLGSPIGLVFFIPDRFTYAREISCFLLTVSTSPTGAYSLPLSN